MYFVYQTLTKCNRLEKLFYTSVSRYTKNIFTGSGLYFQRHVNTTLVRSKLNTFGISLKLFVEKMHPWTSNARNQNIHGFWCVCAPASRSNEYLEAHENDMICRTLVWVTHFVCIFISIFEG